MEFSLSVAAKLIADEVKKGSNVVLSPMSIAIVLNMVALGSNGETLEQFLHFLGAQDTNQLTAHSHALMSLPIGGDGDAEECAETAYSASSTATAVVEIIRNRTSPSEGRGRGQPGSISGPPLATTFGPMPPSQPPLAMPFRRMPHWPFPHPMPIVLTSRIRLQLPILDSEPLSQSRDGPSTPFPPSRPLFPHRHYVPAALPSSDNHRSSAEKCKERDPIFSLANALWVDHGSSLKPSFVENNGSVLKSLVKNVDLVNEADKVKKEVNSWAEKETKGLIKDILSPTTRLSPPLCLANALNFKGAWKVPFKTSNTRDGLFHLLSGETARVPFMTMRNERHLFRSFIDFKLLQLPYQHDQSSDKDISFSMYVFLPHANNGLEDLVRKFDCKPAMLDPEHFGLRSQELLYVYIPKMKFSRCFEAQELVKAKGLTLPFDSERADFTNMVEGSKICISSVIHKAFVEVNEEGKLADAVTICGPEVIECLKPSFVADHPFLFMIVEDLSKLIVFAGAVLNPLQGVND